MGKQPVMENVLL